MQFALGVINARPDIEFLTWRRDAHAEGVPEGWPLRVPHQPFGPPLQDEVTVTAE